MSRPPKGRPHTYDREGVCVCGIRKEWEASMPCASPGKPVNPEKAARMAKAKAQRDARRHAWRKSDAEKRAARKALAEVTS